MNEPLILTRRPRWNLVLPTILRWLQDTLMFWRRVPRAHWDWMTLLLFAIVLWGFYRVLTGHTGFLIGFLLASIVRPLHNNALPILAYVRIRGEEITLGRILPERDSIEKVTHYRASPEDQPDNTIQFMLYKDNFPDCILFIVDEEDSDRLIAFLQARGIGDINAYLEQLSLEERQERFSVIQASILT